MKTHLTCLVVLLCSLSPIFGWTFSLEGNPVDYLDQDRFGVQTLTLAIEELAVYQPPQAVDPLRLLLSHEQVQVAKKAAWLLRIMGESDASVDIAQSALADEQLPIQRRLSAAFALAELRSAASQAGLIAVLNHESAALRQAAVSALGELYRPGAATQLNSVLQGDTDPNVRQAAAKALGLLPDAQAQALLSALVDQDALVRRQAAWAIGRHRFVEALGNLIQAVQTDTDCSVRAACAWALAQLNNPDALEALIAVRESDCRLARQAAAYALNQLQ